MSDVHPRAAEYDASEFAYVIPNESELTAGVRIVPGRSYGFFTDTTVCIGCKACEVACKEWNNLPADNVGLTGQSYDNTGALSSNTWRHVNFIEQPSTRRGGGCGGGSAGGGGNTAQAGFDSLTRAGTNPETKPGTGTGGGCGCGSGGGHGGTGGGCSSGSAGGVGSEGTGGSTTSAPQRSVRDNAQKPFQSAWLMMSDVCKHCHNPPCMEACPTGALFKTEFDTVVVQQDICNGCGYCVPACPFGVVDLSLIDGKAHKCTLCYDRLKGGLEPACAKACPTNSIQFGEMEVLQERARARVETLHGLGVDNAYLYGAPGGPGATGDLGHLNAFFLLTDTPETYNLPSSPTRASRRVMPALSTGLATVATLAFGAYALFSRLEARS